MGFLIFVVCSLCFSTVLGSDTYKIAVADPKTEVTSGGYAGLIHEAAIANADIIVLPTQKNVPAEGESCLNELDNYDEVVKSVSAAAKEAKVYVVAHLYEKAHCQNKEELIRSNLVFNRDGVVISVNRKPLNIPSTCNTTMSKFGKFTTDFGETFGVLMEEVILVNEIKEFNGIKNFIISGSLVPKTRFLFATQFPSSWAYTHKVSLVTSNGIFGGNMDSKISEQLIVADFGKSLKDDTSRSFTIMPEPYSIGDMSQYIIKQLDIEASTLGYTDTLCQGNFCCQFYIKANLIESTQDVSYGLVAFDGVQELGSDNIGVQTCSIAACSAGLYKRSCLTGSEVNTNIRFEKIVINGNFTENSAQFPTILTSTRTAFNKNNFKFTTNKNTKYIEIYNTENVLTFGIFGRVYSRDYQTVSVSENVFSEYISMENVQEFFDYLWIRLRVLLFIVSIYFLEMM